MKEALLSHESARVLTILLHLVVLGWCWTIPRSMIYVEAPDQALWRDLRIWGTLAMIAMITVYYIFG